MLNINAIPCKDKAVQTEESQLVVKIDRAVQTDVIADESSLIVKINNK